MTDTTSTSSTPAPRRPRRRRGADDEGATGGARTRRTRAQAAANAPEKIPEDTAATPPRTRRRRAAPAPEAARPAPDAAQPSAGDDATAGARQRRRRPAGGTAATPAAPSARSRLAAARPRSPGGRFAPATGKPRETAETAEARATAAAAPPAAKAPAEAAAPETAAEVEAGAVTAPVRRAAEASVEPTAEARAGSTLTVVVGRNGLGVGVVDADGAPVGMRVERPVAFPCTPEALVDTVRTATRSAPPFERVTVGVPGTVRGGRVVGIASWVTGSKAKRRDAWAGFDLGGALRVALDTPVVVTGTPVLTGAAVIEGRGLELVVTLDESVGVGLFLDGRPAPQLDLAGHEFRKGATYAEQLGDDARRRAGRRKWNRRVRLALAALDRLLAYDRVYVGGDNTRFLDADLGDKARVVDDDQAGALGGAARLWDDGNRPGGAG